MPTFKHPCPACGKYIARDVARCPFCGAVDPFVAGRCPKCSALIDDPGWVACPKCGTPLKAGVAEMPRSVPAASGAAAEAPAPAAPAPPSTPGPLTCSACGAALAPGTRFCAGCGTLVG